MDRAGPQSRGSLRPCRGGPARSSLAAVTPGGGKAIAPPQRPSNTALSCGAPQPTVVPAMRRQLQRIVIPRPPSPVDRLETWGDPLRRFLRRDDWDYVEFDDVGPIGHPLVD